MLRCLFIIWSSFFNPYTPPDAHAIYVSVIQLEHSNRKDTAQVLIKVFWDDLESALRNASGDFIKFGGGDATLSDNLHIQHYFSQHFSCAINGQSSKLIFQQKHRENDAFWLRFALPCPKEWQRLTLSANYFMELFPTQSNIVKINSEAGMQFCRLTKKKPACDWTL